MLATLTDKPFDDPDWVFETKWDGFRAMAKVAPGHASLYSRNLIDISRKYPAICQALAAIKHEAVLDGELVALDAHGRSRFQLLQNAEREPARLLYCVFDLLYLDGKDLRGRPLLERKATLERILPKSPLLHYSAHVVGEGLKAFNRAKRLGEEGVMAKLATSRYVRDGKDWKYAGRAGTGFNAETLRSLHAKLVPLITQVKPIAEKVPDAANTTWVKPKLVAEVKFTEWTAAGEMRHPVFLGLRTDKKATDVVREEPKALSEAKPPSGSRRR